MSGNVENFITFSLPHLKSQWNEIRGNACIAIGLLHHYGGKSIELEDSRIELEKVCSEKIAACLRDENVMVKKKAAEALGLLFSESA